jgi:hypothetical protein
MIDMKIRDEELSSYKSDVVAIGELMNARLVGLKEILDDVCVNGVEEGEFHDNLLLFADVISGLTDNINVITEAMSTKIDTYLTDIDALDGNIY